ncbi:pre-mRNA-processing factor 19 isoform X2 [Daucus carota subsp. sativus]|uniref:pre-mRNA-processing factor 19 isoform X2 n=1 Tax=Daucus carota subsp. sativus TaxID=79200 RepID=UPI00308283DB
MICSFSKKSTECPVISKTSGYIFDKLLIEKFILDSGKCPITGEPLSMDDIVLVRTPKIPDAETVDMSSSSNSKTVEEIDCQRMLDDMVEAIRESSARLRRFRRNSREIPTSLASADALQNCMLSGTHHLHKTDMPGILSLDIDISKDIIATGGADANAIVYDQVSGNVISALEGHTKQVTSIKFVKEGELVITGSADSTVRVWQRSEGGSYKYKHILDHHTDEVACAKGSERFTTAAFHPDGHVIGTGTSRFVRFWDVSKQDDIFKIDAHAAPVSSIAFSENGYHLATAAEDGVKLWDLRFIRTLMTFPSDLKTGTRPIDFDYSGLYLASGGSHISVYDIASAPKYGTIATFSDYSGIANITSLKFGKDAKYIAAGSQDSKLLLFSSPKNDELMDC